MVYRTFFMESNNFYFTDFNLTKNLIEKSKHSKTDRVLLDGVVDTQLKGDYLLILNMLIIVNDTNVVYTGDYDYWVLDYKRRKLLGPLNHKELDNFLYFNNLGDYNLKVPRKYILNCSLKCKNLENLKN